MNKQEALEAILTEVRRLEGGAAERVPLAGERAVLAQEVTEMGDARTLTAPSQRYRLVRLAAVCLHLLRDEAGAADEVVGDAYYFAARYDRHAEMRQYRDELRAARPHARVTSTWIDPPEGSEEDLPLDALDTAPAWGVAQLCYRDIARADTLVSFNGPVGRGGRQIEYGYARALGKRIVLIGGRETVFHAEPGVAVYPSWSAFLKVEAH